MNIKRNSNEIQFYCQFETFYGLLSWNIKFNSIQLSDFKRNFERHPLWYIVKRLKREMSGRFTSMHVPHSDEIDWPFLEIL